MAKILLIDGRNCKVIDKVKFTEESKLQDYLEEYPSLIPLAEIVEGASKLLCIGREVGAGQGAVDLLFIDKDGLLTAVETKLAKNPEARRTVIGQIIEYASYISQWTADDVYRIANEYLSGKSDLDEIIPDAILVCGYLFGDNIPEMSEGKFSDEDFRYNIEHNLRSGKIRLIIAVDELIESLRATVTFLNSYSNFEILLLQVSNFEESKSRKVLIPSLFGYAPTKTMVSSKRRITPQEFLDHCPEDSRDFFTRAITDSQERGFQIYWGTSGFSLRTPDGMGKLVTLFYGFPSAYFGQGFRRGGPIGVVGRDSAVIQGYIGDLDDVKYRNQLRQRFLAIPGTTQRGEYTINLYLSAQTIESAEKLLKIVWDISAELSQINRY